MFTKMPQHDMNWASFYCKRFDFGVPLEDIFPPNNIHPRLQQLLSEAYELFEKGQCDIDEVLSSLQGSLKDRFKLKEQVKFEAYYKCGYGRFLPGTYFWVIRHFLGLLPIPLLPKYTNGIGFHWASLSNACKAFLNDYEIHRKRNFELDFQIAENLTLLPFSHFLLTNVLVVFLRKVSTRLKQLYYCERQYLNRRSVLALTNYFCSALFSRPFQPGHSAQRDPMFPLLFYMIIRWTEIRKHCKSIGHPVYYLNSNYQLSPSNILHIQDNASQTSHLVTEPINLAKKESCISNEQSNFLKDVSCQTESNYVPVLESTTISDSKRNDKNKVLNEHNQRSESQKSQNDEPVQNYKLAYIDEDAVVDDKNDEQQNYQATYFGEEILDLKDANPFLESTLRACDQSVNHSIITNDDFDNSLFKTAFDYTLPSSIHNKSKESGNWDDVLNETVKTVKKVEEYIYDDYETFKKEDFNQILNKKSKRSSLRDKMSKFGWTYTPPKNSAREDVEIKKSTPPSDDSSYIKYPDVFQEERLENLDKQDTIVTQPFLNSELDEEVGSGETGYSQNIEKNIPITLRTSYKKSCLQEGPAVSSKHNLQKSAESDFEVKRKKHRFNFKAIKMRLWFLRSLTPRKNTTLSRVVSNVKYQRIKHGLTRSNTL